MIGVGLLVAFAARIGGRTAILPTEAMAAKAYGADAPWYLANVPFFECSDPKITEIYAYRWGLYKAHIRNLGEKGYLITEFLDDVGWQKQPYAMLNDATGFHLYEGRWLRDRRYLDGFVDFLYAGGGNDRHFSEGIADAVNAVTLANGDAKWATQYLSAMRHVFNLWDDHYDFARGLYWIEPLLDATEYTVSSIDASGGRDGFRGGEAFRPTINSYMVANARAIARLSRVVGDEATAKDYATRAKGLRERTIASLWNERLGHFTDRYQADNAFVKSWDFVRERELEGFVPWAYGLVPQEPKYADAWRFALSTAELGGPFGLRTVSPHYEYYMRQYRYLGKSPECQWNGPSWPFQTTQALQGMANLLNGPPQAVVSREDYLRLLRQYTDQHYREGKPNLQENYNPDTGRSIVGLERSHHYNHSGYVDLIVTGLCGIRPRTDETLEINPLASAERGSFCLENVPYHGHAVTVLWDADGTKYRRGKGLSVYIDGRLRSGPRSMGRVALPLGRLTVQRAEKPLNLAANVYRAGYPQASSSSDLGATLQEAIDGRAWYYREMVRGWSPAPERTDDWYAVDFGAAKTVREVRLSLYDDGADVRVPERASLERWDGTAWRAVTVFGALLPNATTTLKFSPTIASRLRVRFEHHRAMRLVEFEAY